FDNRDIHVHVPEGATPKDGPSAGVAMVTAIVSVMTGIPVRRDVAMTGEITLRGRVWPIAGLKEKLLAALRGGIKTALIPEENAKDLVEIADSIKSGIEIVPVSRMDEVLARAMTRKPEPIEWDETTTTATAVSEEAPVEEEALTLTAHLTIAAHALRHQVVVLRRRAHCVYRKPHTATISVFASSDLAPFWCQPNHDTSVPGVCPKFFRR